MPLFEHPLENPFLRELYEEAKESGLVEGEAREALHFTIHVLEHRFGPLPEWALRKVQAMSRDQLQALVDRVLDGASLEGAFAN